MNTKYLVYSPTSGYWNISKGWVSNVNDATQFSYDETQTIPLPNANSEWVDFQF